MSRIDESLKEGKTVREALKELTEGEDWDVSPEETDNSERENEEEYKSDLASAKDEIIKALTQFKDAYLNLNEVWDKYDDLGLHLNDIDSAVDKYPFEKSFDEYNVMDWVDSTISDVKKV